mmetsp:Transcript_4577/g.16730  ORF Transcript_4577/g.16730 Transcript_4577/m.16730 type:complete len:271 (-) Transcript_4577:2263-3075(-)
MLEHNFKSRTASTKDAKSVDVNVDACVFNPMTVNFAKSPTRRASTATAAAAASTCANPCAVSAANFAAGINDVTSCLASFTHASLCVASSSVSSPLVVASLPAAHAALAMACGLHVFGFFVASLARFINGAAHARTFRMPSPANVAIAHSAMVSSSNFTPSVPSVTTGVVVSVAMSARAHAGSNDRRSFAAPQSAFAASCAFALSAFAARASAATFTARRIAPSSVNAPTVVRCVDAAAHNVVLAALASVSRALNAAERRNNASNALPSA